MVVKSDLPAGWVQELAKEDNHELEAALGFPLFTDGDSKLGWLMNLNAVSPISLNALFDTPSPRPKVFPFLYVLHILLSRQWRAWPGAGGIGWDQ